MSILLTGAAGFIGAHMARALIARGEAVIGIDSLNDYYDPALKQARLARLLGEAGFRFHKADIADAAAVLAAIEAGEAALGRVQAIVHLAAQAGVRYSLTNPSAYGQSNLTGHLNMLEAARRTDGLSHFVYASSSSVYGDDATAPFSESERCDRPVSLYAATKRANEVMSHAYAHLYGIASSGLRFFTVYGPWGRPDMAYWSFTDAILAGRPIRVFNEGRLKRDFTYIDDIVAGVLGVLDRPPASADGAPHRVLNIGNNRPVDLMDFIAVLEDACGRRAEIAFAPMQPGDVHETAADIFAIQALTGFAPRTRIEDGLPRFVAWFRDWQSG